MLRLMQRYRRTTAFVVSGLFLLGVGISRDNAVAGTATTTLGVSVTINAGCNVSTTAVAFPTQTVLASPVNQTGTMVVTCTNSTAYNVGLDKGAGSGATVSNRLMTGPSSATVGYALYSDAGRTANWGNTIGTDTVAGTGSGSAQTLTVYGQIPAQTTPQPGAYGDTVNVTITF
jgi:spore coat protein U-like protein